MKASTQSSTVNSLSCYIPSQPTEMLSRKNALGVGQQQALILMHEFLLWEWTWPAVVVWRNLNYLVALGSCVFFTVTHWNQSFSPKCHITSRQGGIFDWVVLFLSQLASTESATYLNWHLSLPVESQIKTSGWWKPSLSWPGKKLWHPGLKMWISVGWAHVWESLFTEAVANPVNPGFFLVW